MRMYPKILLLGLVLLCIVIGSSGAATTTFNVIAPSYNAIPTGGVTPLNYSDSAVINILNQNGSVLQSFLITAPPPKTVTNNITVNRTVYVANSISISNTIALQSCGTSLAYVNGSILFTAVAPPCLNITVSNTLMPNVDSINYSNSSYGNRINIQIGSKFALNANILLGMGQSVTYPAPYNLSVFAPSTNSLLHDNASLDALFGSVAGIGCKPSGIVNLWDNATQANVPVCTSFLNSSWNNPFLLALSAAQLNITSHTIQGLGQSWAQSYTFANQRFLGCNASLQMYINLSATRLAAENSWHSNYTNLLSSNESGSSGLSIAAAAIVVVVFVFVFVALANRHALKKRIDELEGRAGGTPK